MNTREKQLIKDINEAKTHVWCGEFEMDYLEPEDGESGWYACVYNGDYSEPLNDFKDPLITEEEAEKNNIDVCKVFDSCDVAYCG